MALARMAAAAAAPRERLGGGFLPAETPDPAVVGTPAAESAAAPVGEAPLSIQLQVDLTPWLQSLFRPKTEPDGEGEPR